MGPEQWQELCRESGKDVWSLIVHLLHFAASEHSEEFRKRRDSIAEVLFSPELKQKKSRHALSSSRTEEGSSEVLHLATDCTPQPAGSVATAASLPDTCVHTCGSQGPTPENQGSVNGLNDFAFAFPSHVERGHQTGREEEKEVSPVQLQSDTTCAFAARLVDSGSAEAPLPGALRNTLEALPLEGPSGFRESSTTFPSSSPSPNPRRNPAHGTPEVTEPRKGNEPRHSRDKPELETSRNHALSRSDMAQETESREVQAEVQKAGEESCRPSCLGSFPAVSSGAAGQTPVGSGCKTETLKRVTAIIAGLTGPNDNLEVLLPLLRELDDLPMTVEILRETHVGKTVKAVGKRHKDPELQALSRSLIRHWKEVVGQACAAEGSLPPPSCPPCEGQALEQRDACHGAPEDEVDITNALDFEGSLPAPPLDEGVLQMGDMEDTMLHGAWSDFDSLESELSGSVASAGATHSLATKTPESQRVPASVESSPCEAERPCSSPGNLSQLGGGAASVLSNSVRKTVWTDAGPAEPHRARDDPRTVANTGGTTAAGSTVAPRQSKAPLAQGGVGAGSTRPPIRPEFSASGQGNGASLRERIANPKAPQRQLRLADVPRSPPPKPCLRPGTEKSEQERLELSKRRLMETYHKLDEAKKAKTIQVVEPEPMKGRPKSTNLRHPHHHPALNVARNAPRHGKHP